MLRERKETLSLAESCTGGYLGHLLTTVPGSSDYFMGGMIAYDNDIKMTQLGVSQQTLVRYGAVSEETVREMATGSVARFGTHHAIATSGVAGPSGGTPDKPVGTVWIAIAEGKDTVTRKLNIPKDRINIIKYAAVAALTLLWQRLSRENEVEV
jgi:nicotinamide-nucleotide amidase